MICDDKTVEVESAKLRALRGHLATCLARIRAHVPTSLACSLANVPCMLSCLRAITTNKFSMTCFP